MTHPAPGYCLSGRFLRHPKLSILRSGTHWCKVSSNNPAYLSILLAALIKTQWSAMVKRLTDCPELYLVYRMTVYCCYVEYQTVQIVWVENPNLPSFHYPQYCTIVIVISDRCLSSRLLLLRSHHSLPCPIQTPLTKQWHRPACPKGKETSILQTFTTCMHFMKVRYKH